MSDCNGLIGSDADTFRLKAQWVYRSLINWALIDWRVGVYTVHMSVVFCFIKSENFFLVYTQCKQENIQTRLNVSVEHWSL